MSETFKITKDEAWMLIVSLHNYLDKEVLTFKRIGAEANFLNVYEPTVTLLGKLSEFTDSTDLFNDYIEDLIKDINSEED